MTFSQEDHVDELPWVLPIDGSVLHPRTVNQEPPDVQHIFRISIADWPILLFYNLYYYQKLSLLAISLSMEIPFGPNSSHVLAYTLASSDTQPA